MNLHTVLLSPMVFYVYLRFSEDFVEASNKRGFQMLSKHGLVVMCYLNHCDLSMGKFNYQSNKLMLKKAFYLRKITYLDCFNYLANQSRHKIGYILLSMKISRFYHELPRKIMVSTV